MEQILIDFTKVEIETIDRLKETVDASKIIGNNIYYGASDIALTDIGRTVYEKGVVELNANQLHIIRQMLLNSQNLTGVLKNGLRVLFDKIVLTN